MILASLLLHRKCLRELLLTEINAKLELFQQVLSVKQIYNLRKPLNPKMKTNI